MEDTMEVAPSEDSGNVPVDAPSEQPQVEAEKSAEEAAQPAEPAVELYELPDGRKVDGETLAKEWKENFYPEYTRKSQALAEIEKGNSTINTTPEKPYQKPDWQPQNWEEVLSLAEQRALEKVEEKEQARIQQQQAVENAVIAQLNELKAVDKNFNENLLFQHANKYGFRDLKAAYQNMKDMAEMAKTVQKNTADNIAKRNDPVSISHGASGSHPDRTQFQTARDYFRSLNK